MRYFVLNSSGNVGKSTVTREVLYSFMDNPKILEIETVNSSSEIFNLNLEKISNFDNFEETYLKIIESDNLILDVGASVLGAFVTKLEEFAGVETLFDCFVIPTIAGDKIPRDTARTILLLKDLGIENSKIKVIFNNARTIDNFKVLIDREEQLDYKFDTDLLIPPTKLFSELGLLKKTINEIYCEDINLYKEKILSAEPKDKMKLVKEDLCNRMAVSIYPKLKKIYEDISKEVANNNIVGIKEDIKTTKEDIEIAKNNDTKDLVSDDDEEL